jgi:glycosyltransferase involved in cell wall biosynthesis
VSAPGPLAGKRIGLLTAWASRRNGGVFEAVVLQAAMIRSAGGEAEVFALHDLHSQADRPRLAPSRVTHVPVVGPRQVGYAPQLAPVLERAELDVLHLHGIWMYPSRAGAHWARQTRRPYIVSPHGMLDPWITARGRWKKALARRGYERASWRAATALHALTAREAADIAVETGRSDSLVVPNPAPAADPAPPAMRTLRFLYLGRIHPKKNLSGLIAGWRLFAEFHGEATLTIAGWGEPADLAAFEAELANAPASVSFVGPAFGEVKARLYREAAFFVLPSLSEGLPMVVLEAWAAGTPAILSDACNLPEGFAAGAALRCGTSPEAVAAALEQAATLGSGEWLEMAGAARGLAAGPFSQAAIAGRWARIYADVPGAMRQ